jgi:hypothetical protein
MPNMAARVTPRVRRWLRRLAIGGVSGVLLLAILGFLVAPPIARHVAQKQLTELLGRKVTIARLRINPFALSVTVGDFRVFEPDQATPFVAFSRLYVNAQLSSVFRRAPVIKEMALESLHVHVVRSKATAGAWADVGAAYNFSDIVARLQAMPKSPEPPPPPDAPPPRFSLNNIHVSDLAVTFDDLTSGDHHEIRDLTVGVPFVSTLPVYVDSFVEPGFSVRIDGTPFAIKGRSKPFKDSLETVLELRLDALDLTRYVPFVPARLPFSVDSARLSLALDVAFVRPQADAPKLTLKGDVALAKLDVKERRKSGVTPLVTLDRLAVRIGETDLTGQRFHVENVLVSGLGLHVRRNRDGTLNLEHLTPDDDRPRQRPPAARPAPGKARQGDAGAGARFAVDAFSLEKANVSFRDESVAPAFTADVHDIAVSVRGLSNAAGATAKLAVGMRAVPGGTVQQQGTLRLAPLAAAGKVSIEGIELRRLAPYYASRVAFDVRSGTLRLGASYELGQNAAGTSLKLADAFVGLADLALRRGGARDDFFRLAAFDVKGGKVDVAARTVSVAEIATRGGRVRAARDARGVVDLTTLTPPEAPAPAAAAPRKPVADRSDRVARDRPVDGARREAGCRSAARRQQEGAHSDHRLVDAAAGDGQPALRPSRPRARAAAALLSGPGEPDGHGRHRHGQGAGGAEAARQCAAASEREGRHRRRRSGDGRSRPARAAYRLEGVSRRRAERRDAAAGDRDRRRVADRPPVAADPLPRRASQLAGGVRDARRVREAAGQAGPRPGQGGTRDGPGARGIAAPRARGDRHPHADHDRTGQLAGRQRHVHRPIDPAGVHGGADRPGGARVRPVVSRR